MTKIENFEYLLRKAYDLYHKLPVQWQKDAGKLDIVLNNLLHEYDKEVANSNLLQIKFDKIQDDFTQLKYENTDLHKENEKLSKKLNNELIRS